jgi:hypothetical protein
VHFDQKWNYSAHPELKAILTKLQARFGPRLHLLPSDSEWLTFQVFGMTDEALIRTLEREQQNFFGHYTLHHQILRNLGGQDRGVSVRYVPGVTPDAGFWYY